MSEQKTPTPSPWQSVFNMTVAAVAGQVGCLTVVVLGLMLLGGLWLDGHFGTRPLFTIVMLVFSVPVTLVLMFAVVRRATHRIAAMTGDETRPAETLPQEDKRGEA